MENGPCEMRTWPAPRQVVQVCGWVPALARTVAGRALGKRRNADLGLEAVRRLLERDFEVVAQVGAAKDVGSAAPRAAEDLAEDVAEHVAEAGACAGAGRGVDAGVAVLVVGRALLRVGQDLVGFLRFLEVLLGPGVVRIAVRMPFHGEFPVRLLDVFLGGVPVNP